MKNLSLLIILFILYGCKSKLEGQQEETWDSGANRRQVFQEEGILERDSTTKDQFPELRPETNQSPSK
jgi:hypothetical protein